MNGRLRQWTKRMQTWCFLTRAKVNTRLRRWVKKSEAWGFFTLVRAVEFLAVLIAFIAFFKDLSYRQEERIARQEERVARAWQLLTTPAPGNSGKGEALEYLNSRGIPLEGIDLTPPILVGQWGGDCPQFTYLREVELPKAVLANAALVCADLEGAGLQGAIFRSADLRGADLRDADLGGADLRVANLRDADLGGADLRVADLRVADLGGADLRNADLGHANLLGVKGIQCSKLTQVRDWETAYRDKELACGQPIPPFPLR